MKRKSPQSPNERYKDAITRSIDEKIKRLEARARPRAGENGDTAAARAKWLQLKAKLTELEVRRRRNELVEVRETELVLSNVMANLRQKMSGFPAHILPEIRRLVVLTPEQLPALHAALKRFTHSWLTELSRLATVTAADAYVRYKLGEDDEPEKEQSAGEVREEKRRNDEKQTKRRVAAKEA
jgi:hypothetical protein